MIGLRFFPLKSADVRRAGTSDEPLRTSAREANTGDQGTYRNLRKIMALPLLPTIEITPMFMWLKRHVVKAPCENRATPAACGLHREDIIIIIIIIIIMQMHTDRA